MSYHLALEHVLQLQMLQQEWEQIVVALVVVFFVAEFVVVLADDGMMDHSKLKIELKEGPNISLKTNICQEIKICEKLRQVQINDGILMVKYMIECKTYSGGG